VKLAIPLARVFTFFQLRYFMRNLKRLVEAANRNDSQLVSAERGR
jgi:hypothetical protein